MQLDFIMRAVECGGGGNCLPLSLDYLLEGYGHTEVNYQLFYINAMFL
jgi:hypothetical protein